MGRWDNKRTIDNQWSVTECIDELYELNTSLRSDITKEFNQVNDQLDNTDKSLIIMNTSLRSDITKEFNQVNDQLDNTDKSLIIMNTKLEQSIKSLARLKIWLVVLTLVQACLVLTKLIIDL
jgi:hypothetical protein